MEMRMGEGALVDVQFRDSVVSEESSCSEVEHSDPESGDTRKADDHSPSIWFMSFMRLYQLKYCEGDASDIIKRILWSSRILWMTFLKHSAMGGPISRRPPLYQ